MQFQVLHTASLGVMLFGTLTTQNLITSSDSAIASALSSTLPTPVLGAEHAKASESTTSKASESTTSKEAAITPAPANLLSEYHGAFNTFDWHTLWADDQEKTITSEINWVISSANSLAEEYVSKVENNPNALPTLVTQVPSQVAKILSVAAAQETKIAAKFGLAPAPAGYKVNGNGTGWVMGPKTGAAVGGGLEIGMMSVVVGGFAGLLLFL